MSTRKQLATAWRLVRPYWVSEERWLARWLLAAVIALDLLIVYRATRISFWQKDFYDALTGRQVEAFSRLLLELLVIAGCGIVMDTTRTWTAQSLEMRWRAWMTRSFVGRWMHGNAFYRIEQARSTDNPDQRIAEDLQMLATNTLKLSLGFLSNLVNLVTFTIIVWGLSGTLSFALAGHDIHIPNFLLWAAVMYAFVGTVVMEKIGAPLVAVDYRQQQCEADFRFLLVRIRENAEQIAFYRGYAAEEARLSSTFASIRANWRQVMTYTKRLTIATSSYTEIGAYVPYLINGPRYFAGLMTFGDLMQATQGFMKVRVALSWFVYRYKDIALLRSVFQRLAEFETTLATPVGTGIVVQPAGGNVLRADGLRLALPDATALGAPATLSIGAGERWLISGASGAGKSTLLRALAGLWPHGEGRIEWPASARSMFVPQQSYLPGGSLRDCLCYPNDGSWFGTRELQETLRAVHLEHLTEHLDAIENWPRRLSPGEQQRLAFARVLLQRPTHLFLDEATSSLDGATEHALYQLVLDRLPTVTLVSVAHRESLARFHDHTLRFGGEDPAPGSVYPGFRPASA